MSHWINAGPLDEIEEEDLIEVTGGDHVIIVARDDAGGVYALDGFCTHERVRLSEGFVFGCVVECPRHNGRFDLRDGSTQGGPVIDPLRCYTTEVRDGEVWVELNTP